MPVKKFRARLGAEGHALFFEVPFDVKQEFGKARPPVRALPTQARSFSF